MTRALMWEARAAEGRAAELERWVREEVLPGLRAAAPDRLELLTAYPFERLARLKHAVESADDR